MSLFLTLSQIGLRVDSGIASIYDEAGLEIENAELLFTEEGLQLIINFHNYNNMNTIGAKPSAPVYMLL